MNIEEEKDQIILRTIMKHGIKSAPQNYSFLKKYNLMTYYFMSVERNLKGINIEPLNNIISQNISNFIVKTSFPSIRKMYKKKGADYIRLLLGNDFYYETFLTLKQNGWQDNI